MVGCSHTWLFLRCVPTLGKLSLILNKGKEKVIEEGIIALKEKKKKNSTDIKGEEHLRFISLSTKFTKLSISSCSNIKGVDVMKHHIKVKENVPIAQKLR